MELWHGSDVVVDHPSLDKCRQFNDYGRGFIAHRMRKWQWSGHVEPSLMALPIDMSLI